MMLEQVTVQLGEEEFNITAAPYLRSKPWREHLAATIKPLFEQVAGSLDVTFEKPEDLMQLGGLIDVLLVESLDHILESLVMYAPDVLDRKYIEAHASDKQITEAFWRILDIADPFGLKQLLAERLRGSPRRATSSNSRSPSGAPARSRPSPKRK